MEGRVTIWKVRVRVMWVIIRYFNFICEELWVQ